MVLWGRVALWDGREGIGVVAVWYLVSKVEYVCWWELGGAGGGDDGRWGGRGGERVRVRFREVLCSSTGARVGNCVLGGAKCISDGEEMVGDGCDERVSEVGGG